jgi:hypothetical protein
VNDAQAQGVQRRRRGDPPRAWRPTPDARRIEQRRRDLRAARRRPEQPLEPAGVEVEAQPHDAHRRRGGRRQSQVVEGVAQAGADDVAQQGDAQVRERRQRPGKQQGAARPPPGGRGGRSGRGGHGRLLYGRGHGRGSGLQ